jgi:hypothetical protein
MPANLPVLPYGVHSGAVHSGAVHSGAVSDNPQRLGRDFGQVQDFDTGLSRLRRCIAKHGHAEGTSYGDCGGSADRNVRGTLVVDFQTTGFGFFEHLGTTRSATQTVLLAAAHFDQIGIQGAD